MKIAKGVVTLFVFSAFVLVLSAAILILYPKPLYPVIRLILQKNGINLGFKSLKLNSFNEVTLKGVVFENTNIKANLSTLRVSVYKDGSMGVAAVKPSIKIFESNSSGKDILLTNYRLRYVKVYGMNIDYICSNKKLFFRRIEIDKQGDKLKLKGSFGYVGNGAAVKAAGFEIDAAMSILRNAVLLKNVLVNADYLSIKKGKTTIIVNRPVNIKLLRLNIKPFSIVIDNLKSSIGVQSDAVKCRMDIEANLNIDKLNEQYSLKVKDLVSSDGKFKVDNIAIQKNIERITAEFGGLSINSKDIVAEGVVGKMFVKNGTIVGIVNRGESAFFDKWYLDFSKNRLTFNADKTLKHWSIKLNGLAQAVFSRNRNVLFRLSSNSPKRLFDFLAIGLFEEGDLNRFKLPKKGKILLSGLYGDSHLKARLVCKIGYVKIGMLRLKNIDIDLPVVYNANQSKKGFFSISDIDYKHYRFALQSSILSRDSVVVFKLLPKSKTRQIRISAIKAIVNLKKRTLKTKLYAKIKTKLFNANVNLKSILLKRSRVITKGCVDISMFDGRIKVNNIGVDSIFNFPMFKADIDFSDINLEKLTNITNFGRISGFVKGYIHNLVLIDFRKPIMFDALVRTEDKSNVSKRIALKAIRNISSIGGGYVRIVVPFFKNFPYSKIGFSAVLKDNLFKLKGLYKVGDREYLVKKGLLIGVSVVNMNSDNGIDWDDMVERIKRVMKKNSIRIR